MTYQSLTERWPHQQACHNWMLDKFSQQERGLLLALPMGVGKSKLAVDAIGEHIARNIERGTKTRVLILCPLSVVGVWPREFRKHLGLRGWDEGKLAIIAHRDPRGSILQYEWYEQDTAAEHIVLIMHYDAAWRRDVGEWLLGKRWNIIVADESHKFKAMPRYDHRTGEPTHGKLAAFMAQLGQRAAFKLALTGTPMAHSPQDIFSQMRFLDGGKRFGNSPYQFLQRYARYGGYAGKEVVGWQQSEDMAAKISTAMWTCPPDVVQLPDAIHETREFDLSPEASKAYAEMWETLCAQVEAGEITAQNGAVAFLRLQQITSGIGRLDGDKTVRIDRGKQKLLEDFLGDIESTEKVVVFCQFRDDLEAVKSAADAIPGRVYGEISGSAKDGLSADATFADGANIVGVQLQSGGVGIDLTAARYCVYFSPGLSLANYEQSLKRVHRPGQTKPVLFLHFNARGTVDETLYERLEKRRDLVEGILELAQARKAVAA